MQYRINSAFKKHWKVMAEKVRENISKLFTDPSWNFSGPIDINF